MDSTVCLTYDFDAVSARSANGMPGFASWGVYGADVAAPRLLDLHERYDIPSTWFVPGHTIESFPEVCGDVADAGHEPYERGEETDIVEVPYLWHREDWMQLFPVVSGPEWAAYSTEQEVFDRWSEEFRWMHEHVDGGVYTLLLYPQCAGRVPYLTRLEAFVEELQAMEGTRFATVGTVAREF